MVDIEAGTGWTIERSWHYEQSVGDCVSADSGRLVDHCPNRDIVGHHNCLKGVSQIYIKYTLQQVPPKLISGY